MPTSSLSACRSPLAPNLSPSAKPQAHTLPPLSLTPAPPEFSRLAHFPSQESTYDLKGDASASLPVDADVQKEIAGNHKLEKKASVDYEKLRKSNSVYIEKHQEEPEDLEDPAAPHPAEERDAATAKPPGDDSGEAHLLMTVKVSRRRRRRNSCLMVAASCVHAWYHIRRFV